MNCPYKCANRIDDEDDQASSNPREGNQMTLRVSRHPIMKESGAGSRRAEPSGGERGLIHGQHSITSPKTMMMSRRQED